MLPRNDAPLRHAAAKVPSATVTRRAVLGAAVAGGAAFFTMRDERAGHAAVLKTDPFGLGVASGDPLPDAVIIWTRLVGDTTLPARDVEVSWEVASDATFTQRVATGKALAPAALGHSVHVDVKGLSPARVYYYRFKAEGYVSPAGRTKTAPAAGSPASDLRMVSASCQNFQDGYWPALWGIAAEDVDVVLHLGDYIYDEAPSSLYRDRKHTTPSNGKELTTLADYRARHEQYRRDPALQAAHAHAPWIAVWDDHDVKDNYAGLIDHLVAPAKRQSAAQFALRRAAAYQAYYEHLPIRANLTPGSPDLKIYRRFDFGTLARVNMLDTRQYRTEQPISNALNLGPAKLGRANTTGTLMGATQFGWLTDGLTSSGATWNVIAQQVMFAPINMPSVVGGTLYNRALDAWDGYAPERAKLLDFIATQKIANPIVLSGDVHSTWFNNLLRNPESRTGAPIATEYVSTSISSKYADVAVPLNAMINITANPHTKYFQGLRHGYLRIHATPKRWLVEERTVGTIAVRSAPVRTTAAYVTEVGKPGTVKA